MITRMAATIITACIIGCSGINEGANVDAGTDFFEVACAEVPGQHVEYDATGTMVRQRIYLAANLGPTPPHIVLGCYPRPTAFGEPITCDGEEVPCSDVTPSFSPSECQYVPVHRIGTTGYWALCGTMTRTGPGGEDVVVDIPFDRILVL